FLEEVREIATRAVVLRDGRGVWTGSLHDIADDGLIRHMIGRPMAGAADVAEARPPGEIVLGVDLTGHAAFELRRGDILGIAGLVGSGRTELLRSLFGLDAPRSGALNIGGHRVEARHLSARAGIDRGLGYLSEDRRV